MKCKTVKDLIEALQKFPSKTKLAKRTKGYFQCIVPVEYIRSSFEELHFTTSNNLTEEEFKNAKTRKVGKKQKLLFITGLE